MAIKKFFIPQKKIAQHHPKCLRSSTDNDYARFASMLRGHVEKHADIGLTPEDAEAITLNLTLYLEDVIAETGIWRGFVEMMQQMYGKYLPFYNLDDDYALDEPNVEDVAFIVWYTLIRHRGEHRGITNPETPGLMTFAKALYPILMEYFEQLPINDELQEFFEKAEFADDFYEVREVMNWFNFDCYLTYSNEVTKWLADEIRNTQALTDGDLASAYYIAECAMPFFFKTGPLALTSGKWLGAVLRANGQSEKAAWVENQKCNRFDVNIIKSYTPGVGGRIQSLDGEEFDIREENFIDDLKPDANICEASFVKYNDEWYINGDSFEGKYDDSLLKKVKKEWKKLHAYEPEKGVISKLLKESDGNPFFYFADADELEFFLKRKFKHADWLEEKFEDPDATEMILGIVNSDDIFILNQGASSFYDTRNILYDKKKAVENSLIDALHIPASLLKYAMEHNMLPDAGFNSVYGEERGKQLWRENYDFVYRAVMGNEYIDR